jgi:cytoskeletal protein CcmA (bactofilin family)
LIQTLRLRIAKLKKQVFGQSSEKIEREIEQLELALEDLLIATAESDIPVTDDGQGDDAPETSAPDEGGDRPSRRRPRVSDSTPRERQELDPGSCCPDCGGDLRVGRDIEVGAGCRVGGQTAVGGDVSVGGNMECLSHLRIRGGLKVRGNVWAGQGIEVREGIAVRDHLEACWGIVAGESITAGGAIKAGESLEAGEFITAGEGYGIYAGLNVPVDVWEASAWVRARALPSRLLSGHWRGSSSS